MFAEFAHLIRENEPLAPFSWLRVGGAAQYFAEPQSSDELAGLVRHCRQENVPVRLLGGGSNLLVRDEGVSGMVLRLSAAPFANVRVEGQTVIAGGGAPLRHLISAAVGKGLAGLESLVGIPGTVGGALHGNAGTQDGDIGQWIQEASVLNRNGDQIVHPRDSMRFAYRKSSLDELVILEAKFALEPEDSTHLTKRMQKLWIVQKSQQPMAVQGVGRIFKDSGGASATGLIEQAGLKGASVGGAVVHDRHPNFIVTDTGASSSDVLRLIDLMRGRVADQLGVELETDIEIW